MYNKFHNFRFHLQDDDNNRVKINHTCLDASLNQSCEGRSFLEISS